MDGGGGGDDGDMRSSLVRTRTCRSDAGDVSVTVVWCVTCMFNFNTSVFTSTPPFVRILKKMFLYLRTNSSLSRQFRLECNTSLQ